MALRLLLMVGSMTPASWSSQFSCTCFLSAVVTIWTVFWSSELFSPLGKSSHECNPFNRVLRHPSHFSVSQKCADLTALPNCKNTPHDKTSHHLTDTLRWPPVSSHTCCKGCYMWVLCLQRTHLASQLWIARQNEIDPQCEIDSSLKVPQIVECTSWSCCEFLKNQACFLFC